MSSALSDVADFRVTLNGVEIAGLLRLSVARTNCFSADTYALTLSMGSFPFTDVAVWSSLTSGYIEIAADVGYQRGYQTLITGMIDDLTVNVASNIVTVEGRDLSSSLIDAYRCEDFVNQTASEIVAAIALHHSLVPEVTPTAGLVGRYFSDGYTKVSLGRFSHLRTDWDLVVQLARENQFDAFVEGRSLFFQPADFAFNGAIVVRVQDLESVRVERSLNVGPGSFAKVQSWDSQKMKTYETDAASNAEVQPTDPDTQPFLFTGANYTAEQVADLAQRYSSELARLRSVLHLAMPWTGDFSPRSVIFFNGTTSLFDGIYRIESIERHYSTTSGSTQVLRAVPI